MKKKIYGALVLGSLLLSGGMVSCSDYDDDINSLNERVDGIEKTLADLKAKIEAGAVITSVDNTENGVKVTLSNGESFELTNGKDGAAGTPGSTVSVDEEGYWLIDGKRVTVGGEEIKAVGEKGEQGEPGQPGEDGKDGKWYEPNEDGFWYECSYNEEGEVVKTKTDNQWIPATDEGVRVVYVPAEGYMLIYGAEGAEGKAIRIDITSDLKSLAVIPEVLDKETNYPLAFFYNIMGSDAEIGEGNANVNISVATSTNAKVHYRLNPANANTQDWTWEMIDRVVARAAGDKNELLTVANTEKKDGELIVTLKSNKSLEDLADEALFKEHAIAALQGTNKNTKEVIASDYVKVSSKDLKDFSIITGYDLANGKVFELPIAGAEGNPSYESRTPDFKFVYTESLDLNPLMKTWAKEVLPVTNIPAMVDDMVDAGELKYEFTLPAVYKIGGNETNQQDFASLEGSVLKVNAKNYPNGTGAIGGTPIVWVRAVINNKTVATAVVKVMIVKEGEVEKPAHVVTVEPTVLEYNNIVAGKVEAKFTWDDMRKVYDDLKITRDEFVAHYQVGSISYAKGVSLTDNADDPVGTQTNAIEMSFDPTVVPSNVKDGMIKITYTPDNTYAYAPIVVEFPYTISHAHQSFPAFDDRYVANNIASTRGKDVNNIWKLTTEIKEHFLDINSYQVENNHLFPRLEVRDVNSRFTISMTGNDLRDQELTLTSLIAGDHLDVVVDIVEPLVNNETICLKTYTVRFINPYTIKVTDITLDTPMGGASDQEAIAYEIWENKTTNPKKLYVSKTNTVTSDAAKYHLTPSLIIPNYYTSNNNAAWLKEFGTNIDGTVKLQIKNVNGVPTVVWNNGGTSLVADQNTKYSINVDVTGVATMKAEGNVKINKTVQ